MANTGAEQHIKREMENYCKEIVRSTECILKMSKQSLGITTCWGNFDEGNYCEVCNGETL